MTVTIDLTPAEEARLTADAKQEGLDLSALAKRRILADPIPSGEALNEEFHALVDLELAGQLTEAQSLRLREMERQMDEAEGRNPAIRALYQRLDEDNARWKNVLAILEQHAGASETA